MNCLVTGYRGFIGAHLANALLKQRHHVFGWDNMAAMSNVDCSVSGVIVDISNPSDYHPFPFHADVVFNTAAISRTVPATENPIRCNAVNVTGALNIFKAFPNARIVHCSSNVVYGSPTPYRASKLAAENYAEAWNTLYGGNIICMRFSNVIGPGLRVGDPAVLSALRDCRDKNGYVEVTGDGTQTRNFTFVDDIVDACILAADVKFKGNLDVTSGVVTTMNEFASLFGCPVKYIGEREGDTKHLEQSPANARMVLGWSAKVGLVEAVERSLAG